MAKVRFHNLSNERQEEIRKVLLNSFFNRPFSQIKVAEIINNLGVARGTFYTYFSNIEEAYAYLVAYYANIVHMDILNEIKESGDDIFVGMTSYLKNCTRLVPDSYYWKVLTLLIRENDRFALRSPELTYNNPMVSRWTSLLDHNEIEIETQEEAISFLYFIMELIMDLLRDYSINKWDTEKLLKEYGFQTRWILFGLARNKERII